MNRTKSPQHILVRMPNWLGDFVMATPILTDLRFSWPEAKITALCQGVLGTVIQEDPNVDEILSFKKPKGLFDRKGSKEAICSLRKGDFDLGLLLTNSFSSAYWLWRGGVKHRVGFATHWRSLLLNTAVPFPANREKQHLVLTYKALLEPLGIPLSDTPPCLFLTDKERSEARAKLALHGIIPSDSLIGINPGAAYGSAKCWLPERFRGLTEQLIRYTNLKVVYFGDKAGAPLVDMICDGFPKERVVNIAAQTTLRELFACIERCSLFLTGDSGPMHVASALGVPLIALFGSTSDVATGPYKGGVVIHKHVECSPCYKRTCPIDFRCMKRIETKEVFENVQKILQSLHAI